MSGGVRPRFRARESAARVRMLALLLPLLLPLVSHAAPAFADDVATSRAAPFHPADTVPRARVSTDGAARAGRGKRRTAKHAKREKKAPKRARVGVPVPVEITYYCLQGTTRTDRPTRDGIVAADPRVFPLRRRVELFVGGESLGRFLVDDTGAMVRGHVVDVWVPSCDDARQRGRRYGEAVLLKRGAGQKLVAPVPP